jgi:glyoxylase-like metal-dependent hydrolase (beta-lactamase superfamily II)
MTRPKLLAAACLALLCSAERVHTQSWFWKPAIPTGNDGQVHVWPVRGNVYMLVGAGGNITVQIGEDGVLVVDSGSASMSAKVLEAVRTLSRRPLRYVINTSERADYTGGNEAIAAAGKTIPFRISTDVRVSDGRLGKDKANVIAYLTVLNRMSAPTGQVAPSPEGAWPDDTFSTPQKKLYFNDEPVVIMHNPAYTYV